MIHTVTTISEDIWKAAGQAGTTSGTGGMVTKLQAADIVTGSGEMMVLAHGQEPLVVTRLLKGELLGNVIPSKFPYLWKETVDRLFTSA